jgi:hypothetical protein
VEPECAPRGDSSAVVRSTLRARETGGGTGEKTNRRFERVQGGGANRVLPDSISRKATKGRSFRFKTKRRSIPLSAAPPRPRAEQTQGWANLLAFFEKANPAREGPGRSDRSPGVA